VRLFRRLSTIDRINRLLPASTPGPRRLSRRCRVQVEPLEGRSLLSAGAFGGDFSGPTALASQAQTQRIGAHRPTDLQPTMTNVVYRVDNGQPRQLDVYEPSGTPPAGGWPVVVAIHGGGWWRFDKGMYGPKIAPLTRFGYEVVAVNYTLSATNSGSWPQNFEDVRASVQWVRANAATLHADPNRIASMGESAGGHLATLLGVYPNGPVNPEGPPSLTKSGASGGVSARVQAVVDISGPSDLGRLATDRPKGAGYWTEQMIGTVPQQDAGRFAAASPALLVSRSDSPMLIFHGAADQFVPVDQSRGLASALSAAGVPNRLILVPGVGHDPRGLALGSQSLVQPIVKFLNTYLKPA
jgi:acetyl esterase/lipase